MENASKRHAGRPAVIPGGTAVAAVHIPLVHHKLLQAEAAEKHWSVSQVLRNAIAQYVSRK